MNKLVIIAFIAVFLAGALSTSLIATINDSNALKTFPFIGSVQDVLSPSDHIKEDQIHVYQNKVVLDVEDASWASFTDTKSMDPLLDSDSNGIEIKPTSTSQIQVGDIISYNSAYVTGLVIHRVIETGIDDNGWYAIVKGDNNPSADPGKVRFSQINGVLIGVIY
jgi:hypothetical protein